MFRGFLFMSLSRERLLIQVTYSGYLFRLLIQVTYSGYVRCVQKPAIGGLSCLVECEDGNIREVGLKDLKFER